MNLYWFTAFLTWSVWMFIGGWEVESWRAGEKVAQTGEAQQQVTLAAEQQVIVKQQQAATITTKTEGNYENTLSAIDRRYGDGLHQTDPATGGRVRAVSRPAAGVGSCPKTSKAYQLTFKQCDEEEAKLTALWDWVGQQRQ